MEQLLRLLPIILAAAQRIPELQQIVPLLTQLGTSTFPGLPPDTAATAAATTLDVNGVKWTQTALSLLDGVGDRRRLRPGNQGCRHKIPISEQS